MSSGLNDFVRSVIESRPRVAVFDCDGTLWSNNSGEDFFYWSMDHKLVSDEVIGWAKPRYADYRAGKVGESQMCGEMTTMYAGLSVTAMEVVAQTFFKEMVDANIFADMKELTRGLAAQGCELWAVSSTNEWVIREGVRKFDIPANHVLAATARIADGIVTDDLTRMPSGEGKAVALREVVLPLHDGRQIDANFGNSIHDAAMMKMARHAYAVNPNSDLESLAKQLGWTVYWPDAVRAKCAR